MARKNTVPQPATPIDFPAEFASMGRRARRHVKAMRAIAAEAYELRDTLLAMHPEVEPWSDDQDRLERLYGMAAVFRLINIVEDY